MDLLLLLAPGKRLGSAKSGGLHVGTGRLRF